MKTYRIYCYPLNNVTEIWRITKTKNMATRIFTKDPDKTKEIGRLKHLISIKNYTRRYRKVKGYAEEFKAESDKEALEKVFVDIL